MKIASRHRISVRIGELRRTVCFVSCSVDQSEVPEHPCDRMFVIDLSGVPEDGDVAVELQFAQNQVQSVSIISVFEISP